MDKEQYDSKYGILHSMSDLETLNDVIQARHDAYYNRKERLNQFIILGRYHLDTCGNVGTIFDFIPAEKIPDIAKVVTDGELQDIIYDYDHRIHPDVLSSEEMRADDFDWSKNKRPFPTSLSWHCTNTIPPSNEVCPVCKEKWEINDCHNVVIRRGETHGSIIYYHPDCLELNAVNDCLKHASEKGENYHMRNFAGAEECDPYITLELFLAGIPSLKVPVSGGEVKTTIKGKMKGFSFSRAWSYWVVSGKVPLKLAEKMYADEEGKKNVRVDGNCTCPPPKDGRHGEFVETYHIDSWKGLKLFANTIKEGE